jgi:predicted short-subunit dehydrogenase-like oxidoreductase (DUF2520 family)
MGQVPERAPLLLVGDGRLAGHLRHYFRAKNLHFKQWSRRHDPPEALPSLLAEADRVLLAIRDDALEDFVREHRESTSEREPEPIWVHFSGSVVIDGAWSAHPLSTFAGPAYALKTYESIPFIVEREGPLFAELLPGLDNPSAAIPRDAKPLYHALCVTAGNFTQLLWLQLFRAFEARLDLPAELALPYLRQTGLGLEQGLKQDTDVLTGPLARRDYGTIQRNLKALRDAQLDDLAGVYEAFVGLADPRLLEEAA